MTDTRTILLISNRMQIDGDIIDLRKITVPLLTIVAKHERVLFNEAGITC